MEALKKYTDWDITVVLPHTQRSWIGKAHMIGQSLTATYIYPGEGSEPYDGPYYAPLKDAQKEPWTLLDGTPASCANVGIHHLTGNKGSVDLVLSGPNFGRNSTALYSMSSGTIGAAMEGAACGVKSIAVSFAYEDRSRAPPQVKEGCKIAAKLMKHLWENWDTDAQLYSVNIPLIPALKLGETKILYTHILENTWGAMFEPWEEYEARKNASKSKPSNLDLTDEITAVATLGKQRTSHEHTTSALPKYELNTQGLERNKRLTQFKWNPDFDSVEEGVRKSAPGNDGLVLDQGSISVTPLRAVFKDLPIVKEIKLFN